MEKGHGKDNDELGNENEGLGHEKGKDAARTAKYSYGNLW